MIVRHAEDNLAENETAVTVFTQDIHFSFDAAGNGAGKKLTRKNIAIMITNLEPRLQI